MIASQAPASPASSPKSSVRHYSKIVASLLAALLGVFGAHWWYLGRRWAWLATVVPCLLMLLIPLYPVWWDNPPFLLLIIPLTAGFIEALVFALKPDEKFDARYNPQSGRQTVTGWNAVLIAIAVTFFGGAIMIYGIAMIVMHVSIALGWLDGLVL